MLPLFLFSLAHAGWTATGTADGCTFYTGTPEGAVTPLRAECEWAIPADTLHRLLADFGAHDDYFTTVATSDVKGQVSGGLLVHQLHVASGISDREVNLLFKTEDIAGGKRYSWTKASDQSGLSGVVPGMDDGKWEVTATATGSRVVHELRYDPGGSVPSFVVRWFQGSGFRQLVAELKKYAGG